MLLRDISKGERDAFNELFPKVFDFDISNRRLDQQQIHFDGKETIEVIYNVVMTYFTADLYLGHEGIIRFCNRPFTSVSEMDEVLIRNWNSRITDRDDVYILGDLMHKSKKKPENVLGELKGRKHLIIGNHDGWLKDIDAGKYLVA